MHEHVRAIVGIGDHPFAQFAAEPHLIVEPLLSQQRTHPRGSRRMPLERARAGEPPPATVDRGERAEQRVVTFSRRQRRHRQELQRPIDGAARERRRHRARLDDDDAVAIDAVPFESGDGGLAGDDDQSGRGERAALGRFEQHGEFAADTWLRRERQVHERDDAQPRGFALGLFGHHSQREAVHQHRGAVGNRRERALGALQLRRRRQRKAVVELANADGPPARAQRRRHPAVVLIPAGPRLDGSGND